MAKVTPLASKIRGSATWDGDSYCPRAMGKGIAHQTGAPFAGRPGLPRSLRVAPFYSQPDRLKPNHSPLHTAAIPTRTVSYPYFHPSSGIFWKFIP